MAMTQSEFDAWNMDLYRRSQDKLRICNPTEHPFQLIWDGYIAFTIQPKEELTVKRYEAEKYARDMATHMINQLTKDELESRLAEREKKGHPQLTKFEENTEITNRLKRTDDETLLAELYPQLVLGLVEKFEQIPALDHREAVADTKSVEERLVESLDRPYVPQPKKSGGKNAV